MIIPNDASHLRFFANLVGRPKTESASILKFNIPYIASTNLLVEKLIFI